MTRRDRDIAPYLQCAGRALCLRQRPVESLPRFAARLKTTAVGRLVARGDKQVAIVGNEHLVISGSIRSVVRNFTPLLPHFNSRPGQGSAGGIGDLPGKQRRGCRLFDGGSLAEEFSMMRAR